MELKSEEITRLETSNFWFNNLMSTHERFMAALKSANPRDEPVVGVHFPPKFEFDGGKVKLNYFAYTMALKHRPLLLADGVAMEYTVVVNYQDEELVLWTFYMTDSGQLTDKPDNRNKPFGGYMAPASAYAIRLYAIKKLLASEIFAA